MQEDPSRLVKVSQAGPGRVSPPKTPPSPLGEFCPGFFSGPGEEQPRVREDFTGTKPPCAPLQTHDGVCLSVRPPAHPPLGGSVPPISSWAPQKPPREAPHGLQVTGGPGGPCPHPWCRDAARDAVGLGVSISPQSLGNPPPASCLHLEGTGKFGLWEGGEQTRSSVGWGVPSGAAGGSGALGGRGGPRGAGRQQGARRPPWGGEGAEPVGCPTWVAPVAGREEKSPTKPPEGREAGRIFVKGK